MPKPPARQSLLAPPMWPFKDLETRQEPDGSLTFNRRGIEHICRLNNIPELVFLEPNSKAPGQANNEKVLAWITEWNALTPNEHWHLVPGSFLTNQEILVFHWYLIYRLYGCVPVQDYESAFLLQIRDLANEAAGVHMHLLSDTPQQTATGRRQPRELPGSPAPF